MLDFEFIRDNWMFILGGLGQTLGLSILSLLLATLLAYILGAGQHSASLPIKALSALYILIITGIPLILLIFFIFWALPQLGTALPGLWAGVLVLGLYYGAQMNESVWAAFAPVVGGQHESLKPLISLITTAFISIIKDSAIISVTTGFFHDVMWRAIRVGRAEFKNVEVFLIAAIIYWVLITVLSYITRASKDIFLANKLGVKGENVSG